MRHLIAGAVVYIGEALLDQLHGKLIELRKIIRRIEFFGPLKTEPLHIVLDVLHVFGFFRYGVGVVKAQVGFAAIFFAEAKVQANAFGVAQMQVAVRLRRKARGNGFVFARSQVGLDNLFNEV